LATGGHIFAFEFWLPPAMCTTGEMKVVYDPQTDTLSLSLTLKEGLVAESDEAKPGIILDYDAAGDLVSVEVLGAPNGSPNLTGSSSKWSRDERASRGWLFFA